MIALLTDFGPDNHYVAQMKGRILTTHPQAAIVDITHSIDPQNIAHGSFILYDSVFAFPEGTIFVVVVDPGVGSDRRIVIVEWKKRFFVLPDNGLLTELLAFDAACRVVEVNQQEFSASSTFHGRDIMAPVAAELSLARKPEAFGKEVDPSTLVLLTGNNPIGSTTGGITELTGKIVYSDCFGNLVSNLSDSVLPDKKTWNLIGIEIGGIQIAGVRRTFSDVGGGELVALIGSHDRLEIAVNRGSARNLLQCDPGETITLVWGSDVKCEDRENASDFGPIGEPTDST